MDISYNKVDQTALPISQDRVSASEYNQIAASLMHIITSAGLTPDSADNAQLLNALGPRIVETYSNGTSWYRVYSDGWCEQGGTSSGSAATDYRATIVFSKQFANTDYTLLTQAGRIDNSPLNINNQSFVYSKSTTGFTAVCYGDGVSSFISWEAKGYLPSES